MRHLSPLSCNITASVIFGGVLAADIAALVAHSVPVPAQLHGLLLTIAATLGVAGLVGAQLRDAVRLAARIERARHSPPGRPAGNVVRLPTQPDREIPRRRNRAANEMLRE